jgi:molybdopterin biosynthesis enzyme
VVFDLFARPHGVVIIREETEGVLAGQWVEVELF